ncbi:ATP-dependent RNA helicase [Lecanora helva]
MRSISSQAASLIAYSVVLLALATIAVILRLISLRIRKHSLANHDLLCLFSFLNLVGYLINLFVGAVDGAIGIHQTKVSEGRDGYSKTVVTAKVFFVSQFFWSTGVASFRLAILFLYIQIFRKSRFLVIATGTAVVVAAYYVACLLTIFLMCRPLNFNWNKTVRNGSCGDTVSVEIFSAAFNMVVDVWVVCLPLPIVWALQMPLQKKVAISTMFALGLANAGINLGRLIQNIECNPLDFTYCTMGSAMFIIGEMATGILVACVPTLGPVIFPRPPVRHNKANQQYPSYTTFSKSTAANRKRGRGSHLDMPDPNKKGFESLDDEDIELDGGRINGRHGYEVHAKGPTTVIDSPELPVKPNEISVRQDLYLYNTPTRN